MNWVKGKWEKIDRGDMWAVIGPHPSGRGRQNIGLFRKQDLTPLVDLIVASSKLYQAGKAFFNPDGTYNLHPANFKQLEEALAEADGVVATTKEGK